MRYKIQSVWEEGQDCLNKYRKELDSYNPEVKNWQEFDENGALIRGHSLLTIELDSLADLENLVHRVGEIIVGEGRSLEIYDDYRE